MFVDSDWSTFKITMAEPREAKTLFLGELNLVPVHELENINQWIEEKRGSKLARCRQLVFPDAQTYLSMGVYRGNVTYVRFVEGPIKPKLG